MDDKNTEIERRKQSLTREDLTVLMESYRNVIESNLHVMERLDLIFSNISKLDAFLVNYRKSDDEFEDYHREQCDKLSGLISDLGKELSKICSHHIECLQQRTALKDHLIESQKEGIRVNEKLHWSMDIKLYGLIGLLVTIIIALIGVLVKTAN